MACNQGVFGEEGVGALSTMYWIGELEIHTYRAKIGNRCYLWYRRVDSKVLQFARGSNWGRKLARWAAQATGARTGDLLCAARGQVRRILHVNAPYLHWLYACLFRR
jgi:hypothetical protein